MKLKAIYEPKGRAKEYSNLALNIYNGCSFKCNYCFGPDILKKDREDYYENPSTRNDLLIKVEKIVSY